MTHRRVLHLVVCAAPPALQIAELIDLLIADGYTVCVIATPMAATWIDRKALAKQTGYPVRSEWRRPGEPHVHPAADVVLVAPATFNTINKLALGISDNLALGLLNEALGLGHPMVVATYVKPALACHPVYARHVALISAAGVRFTTVEASHAGSTGAHAYWRQIPSALHRSLR